MRFAVVLGFLACLFACAPAEPKQRYYVRPAPACTCKEDNPFSECQCEHCQGDAPKCYCNQGGCRCGQNMPGCSCRHCMGVPGGDDGKDNCT